MSVQRSSYLYELPEELIAKEPVSPRDASRLLLLDRSTNQYHHHHFSKFADLLEQGALLVVNNTKVIPARIPGRRQTGGLIEVLLLQEEESGVWSCKVKNSAKLKPGERLELGDGSLPAVLVEKKENGNCLLRFEKGIIFLDKLKKHGYAPLPPYIHKVRESEYDREEDIENYQTIFAREYGAIAAPTAGLHFTPGVFDRLTARNIEVLEVTLHVGIGTFEPIRTNDISEHVMHEEKYFISEGAAEKINSAKNSGRKIIAVGTTVTRTLESAWAKNGVVAGDGQSNLFIYPPYQFNVVDQLLTNFHLPGSTLIMLVAALAGRNFVLEAYQEAISQKYRFYSYGDCMLVQ